MRELTCGSIWLTVTAIATYILYGTDTNVRVLGQYVEHQEFTEMLWPKIIMGIFWVAGILLIVHGLRKIIRDNLTESKGEECYGKICGIFPTGAKQKNIPIYGVYVAVYIPSQSKTDIISEEIGVDNYQYPINSFVKVKYYKGDINIEESVDEAVISRETLQHIEEITEKYNSEHTTVMINGVECTVKITKD